MYNCFKTSHPDSDISYPTYWRIFCKENISFTKLGEEECDVCESHKQHRCSNNDVRHSWTIFVDF